MQRIIKKIFCGLTAQYYFRQLFFGSLITAIFLYVIWDRSLGWGFWLFAMVSAPLYPYSRFVYESVVGFVIGKNFFAVNTLAFLFVKMMTIALCWGFAIFIAPVGLLYLFLRNSKN